MAKLVVQTLRHALEALEEQGIPAAVLGGMAVTMWDWSRSTRDVDLLVAMKPDRVDTVIAGFRAAGIRPLRDPPLVKLDGISLVQFQYEPPETFIEVRIDLLLCESEFHEQALERRVMLPLDDFECEVVACEDLIIFKLNAGRLIDRADAAALLRINRDSLDVPHLLKWAEKLSLIDELNEIWDEAFPGELPPWPA